MKLKIRPITKEDHQNWDELIRSSPQGTIFLINDGLTTWIESDPRIHLLRYGCFDEQGTLLGVQAFPYKKKMFGIRTQPSMSISYNFSPILARSIVQGSELYFDVIQALAKKATKTFPYLKIGCHPSLRDVRPLLDIGWCAAPEYTHIWDLNDPDAVTEILSPRQLRYAHKALGALEFAEEMGDDIVDEFIALHKKVGKQYLNMTEEIWESAFRRRARWLQSQDALRIFTCRKKDGSLLGGSACVLDRDHRAAFGWYIAYDLSLGEKRFMLALDLFTIRLLSGKFSTLDIAEGIFPNLYAFKDSQGTQSLPYFMAESPNAALRKRVLRTVKNTKEVLSNILRKT
jgi:hypothetical protein